MKMRKGNIGDWEDICKLEAACYLPTEAATPEDLKDRLTVYPDRFRVYEDDGKVVSHVNGLLTKEEHLRDEMYHNANLHDPEGDWQMLFGLATYPEYRGQGLGVNLIKEIERDCRKRGVKGMVLTCKDDMVAYYEKIGFVNAGKSDSTHGGVSWYEMRKLLD